MDPLINEKATLEYYDQNVEFENILPKTGTVLRSFEIENSDVLYLFQLDDPFTYEDKKHEQVLFKYRAGDSVHVLLINDSQDLNKDKLDLKDFNHVVWATLILQNTNKADPAELAGIMNKILSKSG